MTARPLFLVIYALSGAAALIYEVAWTRLLGLHMGHSVAAVATVTAVYMGGLALGSWSAGPVAARLARPRALRAYALLEGVIALAAILLPFLLGAFTPVLSRLYANGDGGWLFSVARLAVALAALIVPTAAMGATFPVAARWSVQSAARAGVEAGGLYAANTIGAATGALLAGFALLPAVGIRMTTLAGCALNLSAATAAVVLASRVRTQVAGDAHRVPGSGDRPAADRPHALTAAAGRPAPAAAGRPPVSKKIRRPDGRRPGKTSGRTNAGRQPLPPAVVGRPAIAAAAVGLSGFVALVHEVAWTRVLALVVGPTAYAFSLMLASFIGGLALGAVLGTWIAAGTRRALRWLGSLLGMTTAGALGALLVVNRLPLAVAQAAASADAAFGSMLWLHAGLAVSLLLPMTLALGAMFPLALAVATRSVETAPRDAALVYATNTAGAIAGALAAGFILVPRFGLEATVRLAGLVAVAGAIFVLAVAARRAASRLLTGAIGLAAVVAVLLVPGWDREVVAGGAYKYARYLGSVDVESALRAGELLYYADGSTGTVAVKRVAGVTTMAIDGKVDASNGGDMLTQKLLGHLPLLLHPAPRRVLVVGLGSGVTLGATLRHPIERADILEISPEVVAASSFFEAENDDALGDARSRLILGDGRTHVMLGREPYDVVISEPSNPWMAGMAALFTREFFAAVRQRLQPGGVFCQWAHTYDMSEADLASIAATFQSVFSSATLWLVGESDVLLIGGTGPVEPMLAGLAERMRRPGVADDLADVSVRGPFALLSLLAADDAAVRTYASGAAVQTDDRMMLEYSAPRAIYGSARNVNYERLARLVPPDQQPPAVRAAFAGATSGDWRGRGAMLRQAEAHGAAVEAYVRALGQDARDAVALDGLARSAAQAGRIVDAVSLLRRAVEADARNIPARLELSRILASQGNPDEATRVALEARAIDPLDAAAREQLAAIAADSQSLDRLEPVVTEMLRESPDRPDTSYYAATIAFLRGEFQEAARLAEAATALDPRHARAWALAGAAYASAGATDRARQAFRASLAADARNPSVFANAALLELAAGDTGRAERLFAEALGVDPGYAPARDGLADLLERRGETARASRLRRGTR